MAFKRFSQMGEEFMKGVRETNASLDSYNKNVKEGASTIASYAYANENSNGSIESWSSKQKEGESKARDCFN